MEKNTLKLILASASPRRKELLKWTFIPFQIVTADIEEKSDKNNPEDIVQDLAKQKAFAVSDKLSQEDHLILAADTIVVVDGEVLGKPTDRENAKQTLLKLAGRKHQVFTGVCLKLNKKIKTFAVKTDVEFTHIEDHLLTCYLDTGESMDKAGAYGIQGAALGFIKSINGSYSNVVGLPVDEVLSHIKSVVIEHGADSDNWRERFL